MLQFDLVPAAPEGIRSAEHLPVVACITKPIFAVAADLLVVIRIQLLHNSLSEGFGANGCVNSFRC